MRIAACEDEGLVDEVSFDIGIEDDGGTGASAGRRGPEAAAAIVIQIRVRRVSRL